MFIIVMVSGFFMVLSSFSWFYMWLGLEIMTISLIPLFLKGENSWSLKVSAWKYFIIQGVSSSIMLISSQLMMMSMAEVSSVSSSFSLFLLMFSLILKLGFPPFHYWMMYVMENVSWMKFFYMGVFQKMAPILMVSQISHFMFFSQVFIWLGCISSLMVLSVMSIRRIMVYSSILNMSWIIASSIVEKESMLEYILVYSFIMYLLCIMMSGEEFSTLSFMYFNELNFHSFSFIINFMSVMGLPPFAGFMIKLGVLKSFLINGMYFSGFILLLTSVIVMIVYLKFLIYSFAQLSNIMSIQFKSPKLILVVSFMSQLVVSFLIIF